MLLAQKKGAGRVSPTFEEEIPIDKDDIQEDKRVLPKYDTVINMLKNAVQNIVSPSADSGHERKIYPLHKTKKALESEIVSQRRDNIQKMPANMESQGIFKTNIRHTPIKKNTNKPTKPPKKQLCATLTLIEDTDDINVSDKVSAKGAKEESTSNVIPKELSIFEGRTVVGRERSCDLVLDSNLQNRMVSKVHAMIYSTFSNDGYPQIHIVDCNSTNGTHVDGKRCSTTRVALHDGSTIMFGKKSRKRERRSELVYMIKLHKLNLPPPTPKRIRPTSTKLHFMEKLSADEEHQHYMQPPARHKSSFLYDQLPSTPEVGSEFMHNDSPFVEANMTEETSQARRHEEDNNINYMKGNRIGMLKKKSKKGRRHFEDSNGPHYMESSGYDPSQRTGKFPSLLVVRAPSRGNTMHTTDTLLSKAWPSTEQLNWVVRGSSRHRRIRRRLVQSNPHEGIQPDIGPIESYNLAMDNNKFETL